MSAPIRVFVVDALTSLLRALRAGQADRVLPLNELADHIVMASIRDSVNAGSLAQDAGAIR